MTDGSEGSIWRRGFVWSDSRVDGERLLLVKDPAGLQGHPVLIRALSGGRSAVARVEVSYTGDQGRVHPALARQLAVKDERFEAEWRRARRFDLVWHYRSAVVTIGLITMGSVLAAAVGLHDTARKIGWLLAVLVFVVGGIAVLAKARQDWNALKP